MKEEKQREYYRLAYPDVHRPMLLLGYDQYEVEDISEFGIRLKVDEDDPTFAMGDEVEATIAFPEGREFDLTGRVVRIHDGFVGIELETSLPDSLIRSEALHILYNYPEHVKP